MLGSEGMRALLVIGVEPGRVGARRGRDRERAEALDLLVVCDLFLSETAQLRRRGAAGAQWAEEEGTMTNLEGRVLLRRRDAAAARRACGPTPRS